MKIYLIRHGHYNPQNEADKSLSQNGIIQATRLGKRFLEENVKFEKVYSSTLKRAFETAQICTKVMGIEEVILSGDLVEEKSSEEYEDVVQRMRNFIDKLKDQSPESTLGIFSHSFAIKYLLNSFERDPDRSILPHTGVFLLDYTDFHLKIMEYNPRLHLNGIESY